MTLKIISCNSIGGKTFRNASVVTQETLSTLQDFPTEKSCTLAFEDVWDVPKLRTLVDRIHLDYEDQGNETDGDVTTFSKKRKLDVPRTEIEAFRNLENYLSNDMDNQLNCIQMVLDSIKDSEEWNEVDVVKVLNVHLFNPLSGGQCIIDTNIAKSKSCSCGCETQIEKVGPTGIGVETCWHGFPNMIVQDTIPVQVLQSTDSRKGTRNTVEDENADVFDLTSSRSSAYSQLIAETITNTYAQVNSDPSLAGLPIPTFGCKAEQLVVFAYDSQNDILLKKIMAMKLFHRHEDVSAGTIVMLWLYINHRLFMKKDISDVTVKPYLSEFKADFCSQRSVVSCYKKAMCGIGRFNPASHWPRLNFYSSANLT